jgi:hypothetical protein
VPQPEGAACPASNWAVVGALFVTGHKLDLFQQLYRCFTEEMTKVPRPHTANADRLGITELQTTQVDGPDSR